MQKSAGSKVTITSEESFKIVGNLSDRSDLSDEMKDLCKKLPIYRIRKVDEKQNDADQMEDSIISEKDLIDAGKNWAKGNKMHDSIEIMFFLKKNELINGKLTFG